MGNHQQGKGTARTGLSLKYGFTDTFHIELEVLLLILGQGG